MIGGGLCVSWGDVLGGGPLKLRCNWRSTLFLGRWVRGVLWRPDEVEGFGFGGRGVARRSCRGCLLWGAEVDYREFFFLFHLFGCLIVIVFVEGLRPPFGEVEVLLRQSFHHLSLSWIRRGIRQEHDLFTFVLGLNRCPWFFGSLCLELPRQYY